MSPENLLLDEMWALNIDNVNWNSKQAELPGIVWERINYKGESPGKLRGHKIVAHPDGTHLLLYGGSNPDGR